jgi:hypothetical protein
MGCQREPLSVPALVERAVATPQVNVSEESEETAMRGLGPTPKVRPLAASAHDRQAPLLYPRTDATGLKQRRRLNGPLSRLHCRGRLAHWGVGNTLFKYLRRDADVQML